MSTNIFLERANRFRVTKGSPIDTRLSDVVVRMFVQSDPHRNFQRELARDKDVGLVNYTFTSRMLEREIRNMNLFPGQWPGIFAKIDDITQCVENPRLSCRSDREIDEILDALDGKIDLRTRKAP